MTTKVADPGVSLLAGNDMAPAASLGNIQAAVRVLAGGGLIIVTDDADRENEGDLIGAAQDVTSEAMALMIRHGSGIVCVPMMGERLDELNLPLMAPTNTELHQTAFTVSVDHLSSGTGVSATDRAATVRALADPKTLAGELRRPGHVFPLRYREGGVLRRAGHTEAAIDLLRLAGREPVAVISEIMNDDGTMARGDQLAAFALEQGLLIVTIADLVRHRRATEQLVVEAGSAKMPTAFGDFQAVAFRSVIDGQEHLALVLGPVAEQSHRTEGVLVRVHSECLTGDILGSLRCDCGYQLEQSMAMIAKEGCGVVVYLRGHEGRGIGLAHKLRAYALQEQGRDTVDANLELGLPVDSREYGVGAAILAQLGVRRVRLITNNPAKYGGLQGFDLEIVERVEPPAQVTKENVRYLRTKRDRMGHHLDLGKAGIGS